MARARALPLSDDAVRHILAHVDDLRMTFPVTRGTRPFLAAFLRLVYDATGKVFGAGTTRKLLQLYAPEYRPSTVTIQDEIVAFRESRAYRWRGSTTTALPAEDSVEASGLLASVHRLLISGSWGGQAGQDHALVQAMQAENDRLRARSAELETRLAEAHEEKARLMAIAAALKAETDAKSEALEQLTGKVEQLAKAVQTAQEQVAASHRFALGRIEDVGTESRQLREQLRLANGTISALKKRLADEQTLNAALRQARNDQRSRESKQ